MANSASAAAEADDLSEFYDVFFTESAEHLDQMEQLLVGLDLAHPDSEHLNAIFRAAHSIKGGAATFGFQEITDLTHEMETVFDRVRKGDLALNSALVDVFLASGDMLKGLLERRRSGGTDAAPSEEVRELCLRLRSFLELEAPALAAGAPARPAKGPKDRHVLELVLGPCDKTVTEKLIDGVIADLAGFGELQEMPAPAAKARGKGAKSAKGAKPRADGLRRLRLVTDVTPSDMVDTLGFMLAPEKVKVTLVETLAAAPAAVPAAAKNAAQPEDFGLFVAESELPTAQAPAGPAEVREKKGAKVVEMSSHPRAAAAGAEAASIRVSVDKVDQLINLVGELVITQAMLAQTANDADAALLESLLNGLSQLERNTRDLQDAAMSIRMMPMSFVFSRFPRTVRDLAQKLGKEVELHTEGEGTELDKSLIEHIVDPLTHLVRNSLDHGIETPAEREAKGKVRKGSITLRAYHHGGNIVIEVADDGAGLDRARILAKAKERGMAVSDAMSDTEVWQLIFEAGFSTAQVVTDVSGRGVGMDVVRRNIKDLGGRVEIESTLGIGTRIIIRLPLTLAILDGMSVRVGEEIYIMPLTYITESLQAQASAIRSMVGEGQLVEVRGEYVPIVSLREVYGAAGQALRWEDGIMVILEAEGGKTALFVDELVGQHQVVIKSLEANYRRVPGVSGATIMGDGKVALILDIAYFVKLSHTRMARAA